MQILDVSAASAPVTVIPPANSNAIPLVCDSPHSGTAYPPDFGYAVASAELRRSEDTHVQWLWDAVPEVGGTLIHASFPRSYIDPNRSEDDINNEMLVDGWPGSTAPTERTLKLGMGLVPSHTPTGQPIYARRLTSHEVAHRIQHYWKPYQQALTHALQSANSGGPRWHLNLHSMPSNAYERLGQVAPGPLADVVLGDLHGLSCSGEFTHRVADAFRRRGYRVSVNDPYAGQALLRRFGNPTLRHESLQIELNRALYLNEQTRELLPDASQVRADITDLLNEIAKQIRHDCSALSASH
ncbi:MAG: N-formylglutamate amidohydrolase [Alcaligenaceae bacterium]|nr:MAG: N-formylglutamate amidohydrolase [Alcaligenaceae bacterium]